jgi:hypothetical protein
MNYMRNLSVLIFSVFHLTIFSQIGMGEWRMHVAARGIDVAAGDGLVFTALETGLMEYDIEEKESSLWTDINSLSDIQISCVFFDKNSKSFFVGYENGNIDRIKNNIVTNIPAIKLAQIQGSKSISSFKSKGDFVYACTGFGIVVINTKNNEIKDTYYPTNSLEKIQSLTFIGDSIFALTPSKLYKSSLLLPNLADPSVWQLDSRVPIESNDFSYQNIENVKNELYLVKKFIGFGYDTLFKISNNGLEDVLNLEFNVEIENFKVSDTVILVSLPYVVYYYNENFDLEYQLYVMQNDFSAPENIKSSAFYDQKVYAIDNRKGLVEFSGEGGRIISISGPPKNNFFALGGTNDIITVAGGIIQKAGFTYSTAGAYVFKEEEWSLFDRFSQDLWIDQLHWDVSSVAINPLKTEQMAIASYSHLPLSLVEDGKNVSEVFTVNNSMIEGSGNACISDIKYDSRGNLWILNCFSNKPLKMLSKDKVWYEFETGANSKSKFSGKMVIDYNGNKWFAIQDQGIFGYKDNNTFDDVSDDEMIQINNGENSGALPTTNVTALAVDLDNRIWIGTSSGFAILYSPERAFEGVPGEYNTQRIKIDFEGNVEYLLGNTSITDIEIDGGNRKWIATANAGIFLLSPDGSEIIESFTKENSPLISNNILDMQFNHKSGELFIITDLGLVSYRTNSSLGDSKYENVTVFPNPVKADFNGVITIQGIKYDSDVKVTDAAGNLVFQTKSNGGTATWNGKNLNGEKVSAGTYLFWTASNTESGRKVGKVVILN